MDTKLTLKLNRKAIERAKKYARKHKKSLSRIVEEYFNNLIQKEVPVTIEISSTILKLSGVINIPDNFNLKEEHGKGLQDKFQC